MRIALALIISSWSTLAMATESPKYEVLKRYDDFEVRRYAPYVVAETEVDSSREEAGNQAFSRLAGYIFGGNKSSSKIAMTAPVTQSERIAMTSPVTQQAKGAKWVVQFSMPSSFTMETLPTPNDARVTLKPMPGKVVAVIRYSGTWSTANYDEHLAKLKQGVVTAGLQSVGEPVWARYDAPYTPWFMRTNEVQLELAEAPPEK